MSIITSISESKNENMILNDSQKTIETKYQINQENIIQIIFLKYYGFQNIFIIYLIQSFVIIIFPIYMKKQNKLIFYEKKEKQLFL